MSDDDDKGPEPERYYGFGINFLAVASWIREWRSRRRLAREKELRLREWRKRD